MTQAPRRRTPLADRVEAVALAVNERIRTARDAKPNEWQVLEDAFKNAGNGAEPTPEERTSGLPPDRQQAVAYGIAQFQQIAHERDQLQNENMQMRERIAALEIETEGLRAQVTTAHSQVTTALLIRDQALAERIKYECLFASVQAQFRTFAVPAAPLVTDAEHQT